MNEEFITKSFLKFLIDRDWEILSYDFPQSGTGLSLQPNQIFKQPETKNEGMITPDIIAFKNGIGLLSENKPYFDKQDIGKLKKIKRGDYSEDLHRVFGVRKISRLYLGVVLLDIQSEISKAQQYISAIDFIFAINNGGSCDIKYLLEGIDI